MAPRSTTTGQQPPKRLNATGLHRSKLRQRSHNTQNALDYQKTSLPLEKKPSPSDIIARQGAPAHPTVHKPVGGVLGDTKSAIKKVEEQCDAQSSSENVPTNERTGKILEYEQIIEMLNDEMLETVSLKPQLRATRDRMQRMEGAFVEALGRDRKACRKKIESR